MNREHKFTKAWKAAAKKKLNNSCLAMSLTNIDIEEPSPGEICHVENVLPTGDFYTGEWWNNVPHGNGKYLWTDGCMHFGRWHRGKMTGKGRFSWPSGATYEGEFKAGYMDGKGTFTGSLGYTYRGHWVMNFKHGRGTKSYENGDYYDGDWRRGSHEGHGKYQWKGGNLYIGQWRNGKMHGSGTMIWKNGDRYDGSWEDGLPKGNGTFKWADGSFYVGIWSQDSKERNGTYYPSSSLTGDLDWDPQELFSLLEDCKVCPCKKVSVFPSQKMPNWTEMHAGECKILEGGRVSDPGIGSDSDCDIVEDPLLKIEPAKRQGETISKGHKNYELMLNLQLGIR